MALVERRLAENTDGEFFVDDSCIDCDACRQIAPETFHDHGGQSSVYVQPTTDAAIHRAMMALVACPTASIGTTSRRNARGAALSFPTMVTGSVHFCGYTAESSFGAWSYLVTRPDEAGGNVLVDSPRFALPLVRRIEQMGGVRTMLLTHRDDIADHEKFARHFNCPRVMHEADGARRLGVERVITGEDVVRLDDDLECMPTPGHTRGHQVFLYEPDRVLFTGDHLAWSPTRQRLTAFRDACWYSWTEQSRSMARLLDWSFEWILPGHGRAHHAPAADMHAELAALVTRMQADEP